MEFNRNSIVFKKSAFSNQLEKVFSNEDNGLYNLLVHVWLKIGQNTTISVYPIFEKLAQLFSKTEWLGRYGGLKTAYEHYVPEKFIRDYRQAMFGEKSKTSSFEMSLKRISEIVERLSEEQLESIMVNPNVPVVLRNNVFYRHFSVFVIDNPEKCKEIWEGLPDITKMVLCFDKKSVTEMSFILRVEAKALRELFKSNARWPLKIRKMDMPPTTSFWEELVLRLENGDSQPCGREESKPDRNVAKKSGRPQEEDDTGDSLSEFEVDEEDEELQEKMKKFNQEVLSLLGACGDAKSEYGEGDQKASEETAQGDSATGSPSSAHKASSDRLLDASRHENSVSSARFSLDGGLDSLHATERWPASGRHFLEREKIDNEDKGKAAKNQLETLSPASGATLWPPLAAIEAEGKLRRGQNGAARVDEDPAGQFPAGFAPSRESDFGKDGKTARARKKAGKRRGRVVDEAFSAEFAQLLKLTINRPLQKGPFLKREEIEAPRSSLDYLQNFNQDDFVPDAPEEDDHSFLDEYNDNAQPSPAFESKGACDGRSPVCGGGGKDGVPPAARGLFRNGNAHEEADLLRMKKGFYSETAVEEYSEKAPGRAARADGREDAKEEERGLRSEEESAAEEDRINDDDSENEDWQSSLLRNAQMREKNNLERELSEFANPNSVDASNFDAKGEFFANYFAHTAAASSSASRQKDLNGSAKGVLSDRKTSSKTAAVKKEGFQPWKCKYCAAENDLKMYVCRKCGAKKIKLYQDCLKRAEVASYDKKKGFGVIISESGKKFLIKRHSIWSSDSVLYEKEKVFFHSETDGNGVAAVSQIVCQERPRRRIVGECIMLNADEGYGWIRVRNCGKRKSDIFFELKDYESWQTIKCGMPVVFEIDLTVTQPRALCVRPVFETHIEGDFSDKASLKSRNVRAKAKQQNSVLSGEIIEWSKDSGFVDLKDGTDKVLVTSSAAITKSRCLAVGQKVQFLVDTSSLMELGYISAKYAIDPDEEFTGKIRSTKKNFGFIDADIRWKTDGFYFNIDGAKDFLSMREGDRVKFRLSLGVKGYRANLVEVIER